MKKAGCSPENVKDPNVGTRLSWNVEPIVYNLVTYIYVCPRSIKSSVDGNIYSAKRKAQQDKSSFKCVCVVIFVCASILF